MMSPVCFRRQYYFLRLEVAREGHNHSPIGNHVGVLGVLGLDLGVRDVDDWFVDVGHRRVGDVQLVLDLGLHPVVGFLGRVECCAP